VERDVVAVHGAVDPLGDEVDADVWPAALQVPAEVEPAAAPRLDDAIAQERHVGLAGAQRDPGDQAIRVLRGDAPDDGVAVPRRARTATARRRVRWIRRARPPTGPGAGRPA